LISSAARAAAAAAAAACIFLPRPKALATNESSLWPDADLIPTAGEDRREIIAAFAQANDLQAPDRRSMLKAASSQIDLLDYTMLEVVQTAGVIDLLAAKAAAGCTVRMMLSASDSAELVIAEAEQGRDITLTDIPELAREVDRSRGYLQPLLEIPWIEVRSFVAGRFNPILRFDGETLVTLHLWGTPGSQAPLLHLRRGGEHGLFEQFANHHDAIWTEATDPVQPDPDYYPHRSENPDRYRPPPPLTGERDAPSQAQGP